MTAEPAAAPAEEAPREADDVPSLPPIPPLLERLLGVLVAPWRFLGLHHGGWGWAAPWLVVSCLGILAGVATVANGQLGPLVEHQMERQLASKRAELEAKGIEIPPEAQEFQVKLGVFAAKIGSVVGPPLGSLWTMLVFGCVVFLGALVFGDPQRAGVMRSISLAAWCGLAQGVGYVAQTLASIAGSPAPATSLLHVVDQVEHPLVATLLSRLDPITLYYYGLLALGMHRSCGLTARASGSYVGGCFAVISLLQLALARLGGGG